MTNEQIRAKIISNGVKNLKEFGYPSVDEENILTDIVYADFFKNSLGENIGLSTIEVDDVIYGLIKEVEQNLSEHP